MPDRADLIQANIDEIVDQIRLNKVIPIIGYDLLFNEFDDKNSDDFLKRLIKIHAKSDLQDLQTDKQKTGYELINAYYHNLTDKETFKLKLSRTIQAERFNLNLIPNSYRKLVSIKQFNFFINATFTNILEISLNSCRGNGKTEEEIRTSYDVFNYHPAEPTDLLEPASSNRFSLNFSKPTIYNLFGTHDEQRGDYVLTDADYIELIYDLFLNKLNKFSNLLTYLNGGYLLFLGCNFPDWFFRFFIRVCVGDSLDFVWPIKRKAVIDSLNKADTSRSVFINQYKIQTLDIDCNDLISEIYKRFQTEPGTPNLVEDKGNNKVFISYCRADEQVAKNIASQFDKRYIEYFIDNADLDTGDNLNDKIAAAIDRCAVFLPVVSSNIGKASPYVWKEWKYAIDGNNKVWPVFKDFVDHDMLLPAEYGVSSDLRNKILNKNTTLGVKLEADYMLPEAALVNIKKEQYLSRVSGDKKTN